jgi:hypothetical protein
MLNRAKCHRGEGGQVLAMAVAFIALFGVLTTAVLQFAGVTTLQRHNTERTDSAHALAEGGAFYAVADSNRADTPPCLVNTQGSLTMSTGDVVGYTIKHCNPGSTGGAALPCVLCLINPGDLLIDHTDVTANGPIHINRTGSVTKGTVNSTGPSKFIGCVVLTNNCTGFSPPPHAISAAVDPLAGLAIPNVAVHRTQGSNTTLDPGIYSTISASGNTVLTLNSGIYVITQLLSTGGGAGIVANGSVLLYFGCSNYPTPCSGGGSPAKFTDTGNAGVTLTPFSSGPYAGISMFLDPDNAGTGNQFGKGDTLNGTFYGRSASVSVHGGNGVVTVSGRMIVGTLTAGTNANLGTIGSSVVGCSIYDDSVTGTSGSTSSKGHAVVETACTGGTGIVDLNYIP